MFFLLLLCSEVGLEVPFKLMHAKPDAGKTANVLMFTAAVHICTKVKPDYYIDNIISVWHICLYTVLYVLKEIKLQKKTVKEIFQRE